MSCKVCLLAGSVWEFLILSYYFFIEHNKLLFLGRGAIWRGLSISANLCVEQIVFHVSVYLRLKKDVGQSRRKHSSGPNHQFIKLQNFTDDPDLGFLPLGMIWVFFLFINIFFCKFFWKPWQEIPTLAASKSAAESIYILVLKFLKLLLFFRFELIFKVRVLGCRAATKFHCVLAVWPHPGSLCCGSGARAGLWWAARCFAARPAARWSVTSQQWIVGWSLRTDPPGQRAGLGTPTPWRRVTHGLSPRQTLMWKLSLKKKNKTLKNLTTRPKICWTEPCVHIFYLRHHSENLSDFTDIFMVVGAPLCYKYFMRPRALTDASMVRPLQWYNQLTAC